MVSRILGSEEVGEYLARCTPSRITRNPMVRGIRVLATKSFEGEEIRSIRKVYLSFRKTEKGREV